MQSAPDPPENPTLDVLRLVEALNRHGVEHLIVGGVAALSYGARKPTRDMDCVVRHNDGNLDRLAAAMRELNARLRVARMTDAEAKLLPVQIDRHTLAALEISTWMTDAGPLDVLTDLRAADGRRVPYEELAHRSRVLEADGITIRVAALEDIIASKRWADRPKDRSALPELERLRSASYES